MFNIENEEKFSSVKFTLLFISIAYFFSVLMRMIWVYQFQEVESFYWNNTLMINTNDGYYFASALKHLLFGSYPNNPQIPVSLSSYPGVIYTSALLVKLLPMSLESVILYMPAFISSLVVVPIILLTRLFKLQVFGFLSALLGSIAWSYYNRTMVGYYDSDMFAVLLQMFIAYAFISILVQHKISNVVLAAVVISVYPFFYPQGLSLIYGMYVIYVIYALAEYRHDSITYIGIAMVAIALMPVVVAIKLVGIVVILFMHFSNKVSLRYWQVFALFTFVLFLFNANVFGLIYEKFFGYIDRGTEESGLHFFQVIQTVREAGKISFEVMANRIIGSSLGVIIALIGYILLVLRYRQFLITLPLIGIGIFSLWGGLRFTVFAVPIAAISAVYFFAYVTNYISDRKIRLAVLAILVIGIMYPNVRHIFEYKVPTVFNNKEVEVLDNLKKLGTDKDYVIAWWDYGYPIWFYSNKNTLIDGGKHHNDNYIVSKILTTSSPKEAALLSRIAVESYVDSGYKKIADTIFKNKQEDQVNVESFFEELQADTLDIPKATRDIYLYLPLRMLDIFPTVKVFSNIDLDTGNKLTSPFFFQSSNIQQNESKVDFGSGVTFDQLTGILSIGQQMVPVRAVVTSGLTNAGKLISQRQSIHADGALIMLVLKHYNRVVILDREMFESLYIQMFFLENYDPNLFEPIELSPYAKVYKVKT